MFILTVGNNLPTITAGGSFTRQQGSPAGAAVTVATASDTETAAGSLTVTATTVPSGITVTAITNAGGTITATLAAGCSAVLGNNTVVLTVTDGNGGTNTAGFIINVTANTAPTLTYGSASVLSGGSTTNSPTAAADNGGIASYAVQSQGNYTGTVSVNASGVVSISNAAPVGSHTITIRATDNCGTTTDASFTLTVGNNLPTITAGAALTRQRGSAGAGSTLATVSDAETPVGSLVVTATTVPAGITVTSIINTAGTITATVAADCTATLGANTVVLTVTDGNSATAMANLTVTVTANAGPTLTYGNVSVNAGSSTTNSPTTATDNGSITGYAVQGQGAYAGTVSVNGSGVVSISNAKPGGTHTITVRATDNCGATTDASFTLTVTCPTITVGPTTLPNGTAGLAYGPVLFTQTNGNGAITWSVSSNNLPGGLMLDSSSGVLSGAPTAFGAFTITVRATDANACFGERTYSLTINPPCGAITLTPSSLPNGFVGTAYSAMFGAGGGNGSYTFAVSAGTQPAGLALSSGGALTGTPTTQGTYNFTVKATDGSGCTGTQSYTVIVSGNGLMFYPLPRPVRLMDTRSGQGNCDNISTPIAAGTSLTILARATCEGIVIPPTAQAIAGNMTAINQSGQPGYLTVYPDGVPVPTANNLIYFHPGQIIANNFTVGLSSDGKFNVFGERTIDVVVDISGYYAPPGAGGLYYHPLARPIRLLDTRPNEGACDSVSTPIAAGTSITTLARTTCEGMAIPQAAQALAANATVVNVSGQTGYLTIYPNGVSVPLASNIVYYPGQILSNAFTVSLSAAGEFNIFGERTIHMVIDVAGYYSNEVSDANGPGLLFNPLPSPARILDTRAGQGNCDNVSTPITGGTSIATPAWLTCEGIPIPTTAQSVLGNVTVINQTSQAGYLTLYPDGFPAPLISNMVYFPNELLSNAFVVGVSTGTGQFRIFAERTLDAVVDVSGYFAP
jgi:hypothetical protein